MGVHSNTGFLPTRAVPGRCVGAALRLVLIKLATDDKSNARVEIGKGHGAAADLEHSWFCVE
jgi:hypothetical protein